jgi:hypothetical protein
VEGEVGGGGVAALSRLQSLQAGGPKRFSDRTGPASRARPVPIPCRIRKRLVQIETADAAGFEYSPSVLLKENRCDLAAIRAMV